jgi:hypothetical protein
VPFSEIRFTYPSNISNQVLFTQNDWPFWSFQEAWTLANPDALREVFRHVGGQVEYGDAWVMMWNRVVTDWSNFSFDPAHYPDYTPMLAPFADSTGSYGSLFQKYIALNKLVNPLILMEYRWNYNRALADPPSEGVSLTKSANIEPSDELGFQVYYDVMKGDFDFLGLPMTAPSAPRIMHESAGGTLYAVLPPLSMEYCVYPASAAASSCTWYFVNENDKMSDGTTRLSNLLSTSTPAVLITRNAFGPSAAVAF